MDFPDPKKIIESGLKHPVIDKVNVNVSSYGSSTIECTYDEKKFASVDEYKLEKELKELIGKLGYKTK
ncbi:MAG: hypothetical protein LBT89_02235 [Planctomycetaceae bacterium]|nr:hypothetical protein [Planctomycetaceae bacterium]